MASHRLNSMPSLMAYKLALSAVFTLALFDGVSARSLNSLSPRSDSGINCDGSTQGSGYKGDLSSIVDKVNQISLVTTFNSGDQLACAGFSTVYNNYGNAFSRGDGICASVGHNTTSFTVSNSTNGQSNSAGEIIQGLINHKRDACSTAPTNRQGNKLSDGSISVNYVSQVCYCFDDRPCEHSK